MPTFRHSEAFISPFTQEYDVSKMSEQMGLVDARGKRGVFSRGKPVYRAGSNSPKAGPMERFPIGKTPAKNTGRQKPPPPDPQKMVQRAAQRKLRGK